MTHALRVAVGCAFVGVVVTHTGCLTTALVGLCISGCGAACAGAVGTCHAIIDDDTTAPGPVEVEPPAMTTSEGPQQG